MGESKERRLLTWAVLHPGSSPGDSPRYPSPGAIVLVNNTFPNKNRKIRVKTSPATKIMPGPAELELLVPMEEPGPQSKN